MAHPPPHSPLSIAGFTLLEPLINSPTSTVHRALSPHGSPCLVKLLHAQPDTLQRCTSAAQRLSHPAAVIGTPIPGHAALHMSWLRTPDLANRPLVEAQLFTLLHQALPLLDHLHQRDVVHRDIKPANLIFHEGTLHLIDFGSSVCHPTTEAPSPEGSPAYMAPEVFLQWSAEPAVDHYALAVTLYELLTGALPFDTGSLQTDLLQKQRGTWAPIRSSQNDAWWNTLFRNLLQPHPADRWRPLDICAHLHLLSDVAPHRAGASACRSATA